MNNDFSCPYSNYNIIARSLLKYQELEYDLKQLTGKDLKCLKALFAQGWTLEPPKKNISFEKMLELVDE